MRLGGAVTGLALLVAALTVGCGHHAAAPQDLHELPGTRVAAMAERRLEQQNPRIAPGRLSCPDLAWRVGASVRCLRSTELSGGRLVKVAGTVTVTSMAEGGRLHVAMDERAAEFGLAGTQLATEVRRLYPRRFHGEPTALTCPYLLGVVGTRVTCRAEVGGARRDLDVVVSAVDPTAYRATYSVRLRHAS